MPGLIIDKVGKGGSTSLDPHYGAPVASLAELAALSISNIVNDERRFVGSEDLDYFYDAEAISGDVMPLGQVNGKGFWIRKEGPQGPQGPQGPKGDPGENAHVDNELKVYKIPVSELSATPTDDTIAALVAEWFTNNGLVKLDIQTIAWETTGETAIVTTIWDDTEVWDDTKTWTEQ